MDNVSLQSPFGHLSLSICTLICFVFSTVYVLALYLLSPSNHRYDRNHPTVILSRFLAVFIVCSSIYLFFLLFSQKDSDIHVWLGFRSNIPSIFSLVFVPSLLTLLLFLGPIVQGTLTFDWRYYELHGIHNWSTWSYNAKLIFLRNYLVAPFTEGQLFDE